VCQVWPKSVMRLQRCGGRKWPFPINLASGLYNSLYYRTSRDILGLCGLLVLVFSYDWGYNVTCIIYYVVNIGSFGPRFIKWWPRDHIGQYVCPRYILMHWYTRIFSIYVVSRSSFYHLGPTAYLLINVLWLSLRWSMHYIFGSW